MLLTMGLILAFCSCFIEVKMVTAWPALERAYLNGIGPISGTWINNGASMLLSFLMGVLFGVEGVTMAFAGIISIPMSNMWFIGKKLANDHGVTIESTKSTFSEKSGGAIEWWEANAHYFHDLVKTIFILIKVITWPLRAALKANSYGQEKRELIIERVDEGRDRLSAWKSSELRWQLRGQNDAD